MFEKTNWKPVYEYEGFYEVNEDGEIRSLHKRHFEKLLAKRINKEGYHQVNLSKNGKLKTLAVHRIVGFAFLHQPEGKKHINHIDANKLNNKAENLEWCDHSHNIRHAFSLGLIPRKKIPVIDNCSGKVFSCSKEAAEFYGINHSTMRNYLSGNIKTNPTCAQYLREAA